MPTSRLARWRTDLITPSRPIFAAAADGKSPGHWINVAKDTAAR
jgi:hypothetical protein